MYKIGVCIPYFGKFNSFFDVWLLTASYNETIDFLIFSDDVSIKKKCDLTHNVFFKQMTLNQLNVLVASKIHPKAKISRPYKLCDFKPTYGILFEDYLTKYDFWGYCDIDLIFGNIRRFITDDILDKHDHILSLGHFSLNRNNSKMNNLFRKTVKNGAISFPYVFFPNTLDCVFDENQFNQICKKEKINSFYNNDFYCDCIKTEYGFKNRQNVLIDDYFVAFWAEGKLVAFQKGSKKPIEQLYVHAQKRDFCIRGKIDNYFFLAPNVVCSYPVSKADSLIIDYHDKEYEKLIKKTKLKTPLINRVIRKLQIFWYGRIMVIFKK